MSCNCVQLEYLIMHKGNEKKTEKDFSRAWLPIHSELSVIVLIKI